MKILFFKAASMREVTVPAYTRSNGTLVPMHRQKVRAGQSKPSAGGKAQSPKQDAGAGGFTADDVGFLQTASSKVMGASARGEIDLNRLARKELASRGMDTDGKWVGFQRASEIDASSPPPATGGLSEDELGFFQTAPTKVLSAAAKGALDLNRHARREMAGRGQDNQGRWVGFDRAREIHNV